MVDSRWERRKIFVITFDCSHVFRFKGFEGDLQEKQQIFKKACILKLIST